MRNRLAIFLLFVALAPLAYAPAWHGGFLWDDDGHVTKEELRSADGLRRIWLEPGATQQYYPLTHTAFWVMHRLWGDDTTGYHAVNIALHAIAAGLLVLILRQLAIPGALLAGLIFAVHPVHVESVAWITELKNTLSGVLYLAAALVYLEFDRARRPAAYALASALFVLALLAKTVTATLPGGLLVVLWWKRGTVTWSRDVRPLVPWIVVGAAAGLTTAWVERTYIGAVGADFTLTPIERVLVAGRAIWFYLATLAWPAELIFIYPRWNVSAADWTQYLYPITLAVVLAALWYWRRQARAALAALLFFIVTLGPALGFVDVFPFRYSFVADHFQYLASLGIITLGSAAAAHWAAHGRPRVSAHARRAAAAVVVALLGVLTWRQSAEYVSAEVLYRETLRKHPECWLALHNLGLIRLGPGGDIDEAASLIAQSLQVQPNNPEAHNSLGLIRQQQGRTDEAEAHFREAIRLLPSYAAAQNSLGVALYAKGHLEQAVAQYRKALGLNPGYAEAHRNLGMALIDLGRPEDAVAELEEAIRLNPRSHEAHDSLGTALVRLGDGARAAAHYREALALAPDSASIRNNLAIALQQQGLLDDAIKVFSDGVRLRPDLARLRDNLGWALFRARRLEEAEREIREALRLDPQFGPAHGHLANLLHSTGRISEAIPQYRAAIPVADPVSRPLLHNDLGVALASVGRTREAIVEFREALRQAPDLADARRNLARAGGS
jgi:tetratricopeptide (TPR) repeat protein